MVVVVAHPDDETFGCGSLIAHSARRGAHVTVISATRGEAGERTPTIAADADLGDVRAAELFEAARLLGADDVELLHYADSGFDGELPVGSLCAAPLAELTRWLVGLVGLPNHLMRRWLDEIRAVDPDRSVSGHRRVPVGHSRPSGDRCDRASRSAGPA